MHLRTLLVSALTAVVLITGSGFVVSRADEANEPAPDGTAVVRAVRVRWEESGAVDGRAMQVRVLDGRVDLEGYARSRAEALLAEDLAWRVNGVTGVENRLVTRP